MARSGSLRKPTNISARPELVAEAKALGINLSHVFEVAVEQSVKEVKQQRWVEGNKQAFADYDSCVETYGLYSAGKRLF